MSKYVVLGAIGQTGSEQVKYLLPRPSTQQLHVHARSDEQLKANHPALASSTNATTYIGEISDVQLSANCLRDVDVVFSAVAQNLNEPVVTIGQRTAHTIVAALELLRAEGQEQRLNDVGGEATD